jgi:hypothetical protein
VNIKVSRTGLIDALKKAIKTREAALAEQEKAHKEFEKAQKEYEDKVLAYITSGKATNPKLFVRYDGEATVTVELPAALKKGPKQKDVRRYYSVHEIPEIKSAIALLELSEEDTISASAYKNVAQYLA